MDTGGFWVGGGEQEQEADVGPGVKGTTEARKALPLGMGVLSEVRSKTYESSPASLSLRGKGSVCTRKDPGNLQKNFLSVAKGQ